MTKKSFFTAGGAEGTGRHAEMVAKDFAKLVIIRETRQRGDMQKLHALVLHQKSRKEQFHANEQLLRRDLAIMLKFADEVATMDVQLQREAGNAQPRVQEIFLHETQRFPDSQRTLLRRDSELARVRCESAVPNQRENFFQQPVLLFRRHKTDGTGVQSFGNGSGCFGGPINEQGDGLKARAKIKNLFQRRPASGVARRDNAGEALGGEMGDRRFQIVRETQRVQPVQTRRKFPAGRAVNAIKQ